MTLICPGCGRARVRRHARLLQTCGDPACRYTRNNREPALKARQQQVDERMRAVVAFHFGSLSDREVRLFRHVWGIAWKRGYEKGKSFRARTRPAAA